MHSHPSKSLNERIRKLTSDSNLAPNASGELNKTFDTSNVDGNVKRENHHLIQTPLPSEIWYKTFGFLSKRELIKTKLVCSEFNEIIKYKDDLILRIGPDYTQKPSIRLLCEVNVSIEDILMLPNGGVAVIAIDSEKNLRSTTSYSRSLLVVDNRGKQKKMKDDMMSHRLMAALPNSNFITLELGSNIHIWDFETAKKLKIISITSQEKCLSESPEITNIKILSADKILTVSKDPKYCQNINVQTGKMFERYVDLKKFALSDSVPLTSEDHFLNAEIKAHIENTIIEKRSQGFFAFYSVIKMPNGDLIIKTTEFPGRTSNSEIKTNKLELLSYPQCPLEKEKIISNNSRRKPL